MKFLIQNYTSALSTEPMYLDQCFKQTGAITSAIWDTNAASTYDALDSFNPDVLLCHYSSSVLNDILKYLSQNKKIELVVNITGAQDNHIQILENLIEKNNISSPFFISNLHEKIYSPKSKKKIFNMLPGVDLFLPKQNIPDFNIEAAILSNNKELAQKTIKGYETYHKLGIGSQDEYFDFSVSVASMTSFYEKYNKIILAADLPVVFSQFFFDAVYKSKKVVIKSSDEKTSSEILSDLFHSNEDNDIAVIVKNQIRTKHTCFNRAERLARAFKLENAAKILNDLGNKI
jgi:hypothetical protein